MSLCQKSRELLQELKRSEWLPEFNEDGIRLVTQEMNELHEKIVEKFRVIGQEIEEHESMQCALIIQHQSLLRNKRCLLAYMKHRLNKIKDLRWDIGSVVPERLRKNLCTKETEFFSNYDQLLTGYMASFDLDLTSDMEPPKDLYIEVRVVEDCGEIFTENGSINLTQNSSHFVKRTHVEPFIRQGMVVEMNTS